MIQQGAQTGREAFSHSPRNALSQYYEALYWRIREMRNGTSHLPYSIGLTSFQPGEGVTTSAANLATSAARIGDGPVVLVEATAAQRSVAHRFGVAPSPGVHHALHADTCPTSCTHATSYKNLSVVPSGVTQSTLNCEPSRFAAVIESLKEEFPLVIVDLPTANDLSPCYGIAGCLDGVLLVLQPSRVSTDLAIRTKQRLESAHAQLLGVIVNNES